MKYPQITRCRHTLYVYSCGIFRHHIPLSLTINRRSLDMKTWDYVVGGILYGKFVSVKTRNKCVSLYDQYASTKAFVEKHNQGKEVHLIAEIGLIMDTLFYLRKERKKKIKPKKFNWFDYAMERIAGKLTWE